MINREDCIEITDYEDPRLDVFARLNETQLRHYYEPDGGLFIAESPKVALRALRGGCRPVSVLVEHSQIEGEARGFLNEISDVPVFTGTAQVLRSLTNIPMTRGLLCCFERPALKTVEEITKGCRRIAVLEGITEPSNLGAIFRSAAALGTDGILLTPECCDPYHRRAVRVCMGAVFTVPWARTGEDHGFGLLREHRFFTVGLALRQDALRIDDPELTRPEKVAVYLGTEDTGLREETIARCDRTAVIPMAGGIDSLNVAAASAVAFWQLRRKE